MKNLGPWLVGAGFGILLFFVIQASHGSPDTCRTGPFSFDGSDVWNTRRSQWVIGGGSFFPSDRFMELEFGDSASYPGRYGVWSPPLCAPANGTYELSFTFSIAGFLGSSGCYLAVHVLRDGVLKQIWRSSGGTWIGFQRISPPLTFSCCSPEFKFIFEGVKVEEGKCGFIFDTVRFDDVSYTYVDDNPKQKHMCPADEPDHDENRGVLGTGVVIAIIISSASIVIVIAVLVFAAVLAKRKRGLHPTRKDSSSVGYQTFVDEPRQRGSTSDYEPVDNDRKQNAPLPASGGNGSYNTLRMTGGAAAAAAAPHGPSAHYDHFDGDTAYSKLDQLKRSRDQQRMANGRDYSHI